MTCSNSLLADSNRGCYGYVAYAATIQQTTAPEIEAVFQWNIYPGAQRAIITSVLFICQEKYVKNINLDHLEYPPFALIQAFHSTFFHTILFNIKWKT